MISNEREAHAILREFHTFKAGKVQKDGKKFIVASGVKQLKGAVSWPRPALLAVRDLIERDEEQNDDNDNHHAG